MLKELGKSLLIYGLSSSIGKFAGIFMVPIFSRYYSPEEYGSIDLISTVISLVSLFGMLQLESAISRFYFETKGENELKEYISTGLWTITILSTLLFVVLLLASPAISKLIFGSREHEALLRLAAVNVILLNLFGYLTVLMRFRKKPILYSLVIFLQVLVTVGVSIISIIAFDQGLKSFFLGQIAGLCAANIVLFGYFRNSLVYTINIHVLKEFFRYSLPQVPAVAGGWINSYANRFLMVGYLTITDVGIYTVALKVASIFNLVDHSFRMAWEPILWKRITSTDHKYFLRKISSTISIVVFILSLFCILWSRELLLILSTADYLNAVPITQILFYALAFPVLIHIFGVGTSISKKTIYNTVSFLSGSVVNLTLLFILVPRFGLPGVAFSLALSNIFIFGIMFYLSEKQYHIGFSYKQQFLLTVGFSLLAFVFYRYDPSLLEKLLLFSVLLIVGLRYRNKIQVFINDNLIGIATK